MTLPGHVYQRNASGICSFFPVQALVVDFTLSAPVSILCVVLGLVESILGLACSASTLST